MESSLVRQIKRALTKRGAYVAKQWTGGVYSQTGRPDIFACVQGIFVAIETKQPGRNRPSAIQQARIEQIRMAGGIAFWCDSVAAANDRLAEVGL